MKRKDKEREFQLHHTGIKTQFIASHNSQIAQFQLHHTGIKTLLHKKTV